MNDYQSPRHPLPVLPRDGGDLALPPEHAGLFVAEEQEDSVLRRYWRTFYRYRYVILVIAALGLMGAVVVSMLTRPVYAGTVTIQVAREEAKVLNIEGMEQSGSAGSNPEFYQTQYALLKSRSLSEAVVQSLGLADNYLFLSDFNESKVDEIKSLPRATRAEMAIKEVNTNTVVNPVRMSSIINVSYRSLDPQNAATVANAIAENFVQSNLSRRYEAAAYARQFLSSRLNQVRARLEESERKAVRYAQQQGLIKVRTGEGTSGSEQSILADELTSLSRQLTIARAQRAQAEAQYRAGTSGSIAAQSLENISLNSLHRLRAELLGQLGKLESDFGPEYPQVVALRAQISELDRQISREQGRVSSSVAQDVGGRYRQALAAENSLQSRVDSLKSQLLGEQGRSIQFNILQRDVDTNRALYDALLQRFKEIGIAGGVGTNNISIVDKAVPPASPFKPNLPLNLAIGLFVGLVGGVGMALILSHLEESELQPRDVLRKLGVPLLGVTPRLAAGANPRSELSDPKSALSEAYFSTLISLQFSTAHGAPKSLLVTSSQAQEGKSTSSVALAAALVRTGSRVLLIDSDMRNPSLHHAFSQPLSAGLSNLLSGHGRLGDYVKETDIAGLSLVMAGKIPPNPAELLSGDVMGRLIRDASKQFDHVIVDGPPVLGLADSPLLSRSVEATVLVIESGRTSAPQARHSVDRLSAVGAYVIGALLTKFDIRTAGYGYGYGYEYRYGETAERRPALAQGLAKLLPR